jgi:hypothetical protein
MAKKLVDQVSKFTDAPAGALGEFKPDRTLLKATCWGSSAKDIRDGQITILDGMTEEDAKVLRDLHCGTVSRLASHAYCRLAEGIVALAPLQTDPNKRRRV